MSDSRPGKLNPFVKPVDRLRIYSVIASCSSNGLAVKERLAELLAVYQKRNTEAATTALISAVVERLEAGDGIGKAILATLGEAAYPEETVLIAAVDAIGDPAKAARLFGDAIQFINLEQRIRASESAGRRAS
jgi:hypothetical protein